MSSSDSSPEKDHELDIEKLRLSVAPMINGGDASSNEPSIDIEKLRLTQDYTAFFEQKKAISAVSIRKPDGQTWFFPDPDPQHQFAAQMIALKEDGEHYVVAPEMLEELRREVVPKVLIPILTKRGVPMFWPIRLPGADGKNDSWNASALPIAQDNLGKWTRLLRNHDGKVYEAAPPPISPIPDPVWPLDYKTMLGLALKGRVITSLDHPVVKQLRGAQ